MLSYQIEVDGDWCEIIIETKPQRRDLQLAAIESGEHKGKWVFRIANTDYGWSLRGPSCLRQALVYGWDDLPCVVAGQNRTPVHRRIAKCLDALTELWLEVDDGAIAKAYV